MRGAECRRRGGPAVASPLSTFVQPAWCQLALVGAGRSGFETNPKRELNSFITNNTVILTLVRARSPKHRGTSGTNEARGGIELSERNLATDVGHMLRTGGKVYCSEK